MHYWDLRKSDFNEQRSLYFKFNKEYNLAVGQTWYPGHNKGGLMCLGEAPHVGRSNPPCTLYVIR